MIKKIRQEDIRKIENLLASNQDFKALEVANNLLNKFPLHPIYLNIKGYIYLKNKKYSSAKPFFEQAIKKDSKYLEAYINLALCHLMLNNNLKVFELLKKVLKFDPQNFDALYNLANLNYQNKFYKEAKHYFLKLLLIDPANDEWINALWKIALDLNDIDGAVQFHEQIKKKNSNFYLNRGVLHSYQNKMILAKSDFLKCIENSSEKNSEFYLAYFNLLDKTDFKLSEKELNHLENSLKSNLPNTVKENINYTLAKHYENKSNYDKSILYYHHANSFAHQENPHNKKTTIEEQEKIYEVFEKLKELDIQINNIDTYVIFVVGMPRCGSTMLERIISQDNKTYPVGETSIISSLLKDLSVFDSMDNINNNVNLIRESFFQKIGQISNKKILIEKSLSNFKRLGLIKLIFPEAKFINLYRDPIATCFSNYKTAFKNKKGSLNFSSNLENLVFYYKFYLNVIKRWEKYQIQDFMSFNYEDLTNNPDEFLPEVFNFVGIEYKEQYLDINKSKYILKTASLKQANKNIYKGSSEEWKKYRDHLEILINGLVEK